METPFDSVRAPSSFSRAACLAVLLLCGCAGMDAVIRVNERLKADLNRRDPAAIAEAERTLRAQGFSSLSDFMDKMSSQFESLKTM
jgi:ABC-type phosphate transport system substrate-binding protein